MRKLEILAEGSKLHAAWIFAKEITKRSMEKPKSTMLYTLARDALDEAGGWIIAEVAIRVSKSLSYLCMHSHTVALLAVVLLSGDMPKRGTFHSFVEVSRQVPDMWFGKRYWKLVTRVKRAMCSGLKKRPSVDELKDIYRTIVWLSRNFIHQFQPEYVEYSAGSRGDLAQPPLCEDGTVSPRSVASDHQARTVIANLDKSVVQFVRNTRAALAAVNTIADLKRVQHKLSGVAYFVFTTYQSLEQDWKELAEGVRRYGDRAVVVSTLMTSYQKATHDVAALKKYMDCVDRLQLEGVAKEADVVPVHERSSTARRIIETFGEVLVQDAVRMVDSICEVLEEWTRNSSCSRVLTT